MYPPDRNASHHLTAEEGMGFVGIGVDAHLQARAVNLGDLADEEAVICYSERHESPLAKTSSPSFNPSLGTRRITLSQSAK